MSDYLTYIGTDLSVATFAAARRELTAFMLELGEDLVSWYGFGWDTTERIPSGLPALRAAFERSRSTGAAMPIPDHACSTMIYTDSDAQHSYSFWHALGHAEGGFTFAESDELDLVFAHLKFAKECGLSELSLAVLRAELIGTLILTRSGDGPAINRLRFASDVLMFGVVDAVLLERQRQRLAAA